MKAQIPRSRTSIDVFQLIESAKDAELCRNIELSRQILSPVWSDIEKDPDLAFVRGRWLAPKYCDYVVSPELLRAIPRIKDYQLRGKDLLHQRIQVFSDRDWPDRAAEANVMLAPVMVLCEIDECELIWKT